MCKIKVFISALTIYFFILLLSTAAYADNCRSDANANKCEHRSGTLETVNVAPPVSKTPSVLVFNYPISFKIESYRGDVNIPNLHIQISMDGAGHTTVFATGGTNAENCCRAWITSTWTKLYFHLLNAQGGVIPDSQFAVFFWARGKAGNGYPIKPDQSGPFVTAQEFQSVAAIKADPQTATFLFDDKPTGQWPDPNAIPWYRPGLPPGPGCNGDVHEGTASLYCTDTVSHPGGWNCLLKWPLSVQESEQTWRLSFHINQGAVHQLMGTHPADSSDGNSVVTCQ